MKVDMNKAMLDLKGDAIVNNDAPLTLGAVCNIALNAPDDADKGQTPDKAVERWKLMMRIHEGGEVELTPEQVTMLRSKIVKSFAPIVAGQACSLLG